MKVKLILNKGGMSLVEWKAGDDKMPTRSWVKASDVEGDQVEHPEHGVPYGLDFSRMIQLETVTPRDIMRELRKVGIWTVADLRDNPNLAVGAITSAYGMTLSTILQAVERSEKSA